MAPKVAHLEQGKTIPIHAVKIGDRLLVKPQEIIPVDATLASKHALVDESSLTGESRPVEYAESDALLSGSINGDSAIVIVATQTAAKSEYQKIIQLVEAASSVEKSPFVRLADRYAVPFTIIAFGIAGLAWYISGDALRFAQVLVVATNLKGVELLQVGIALFGYSALKHKQNDTMDELQLEVIQYAGRSRNIKCIRIV
jgi:P-type E1-E2 ATPase